MKQKKYRITWDEEPWLEPQSFETSGQADAEPGAKGFQEKAKIETTGDPAEQKPRLTETIPDRRAPIVVRTNGSSAPSDTDALFSPQETDFRQASQKRETDGPTGYGYIGKREQEEFHPGGYIPEPIIGIRETGYGTTLLRPFEPQTVSGRSEFTVAATGREPAGYPANPEPAERIGRNDVESMIDRKLAGLRVYVLESDITDAQQAVRSIVEQASF